VNEAPHSRSEQIAHYLSGEADAAERNALEAWAAEAPAHAEELERMRRAWDLSAGSTVPDVDVDRAWARVQARIDAADGRGKVVPMQGPGKAMRWFAAAAMVTGLALGVQYWFTQRPQELMATNAHVRTVLNDNSTVVLSPGTHLNVRMADERSVHLNGQAYFEVQRDVERPFVVHTDDVTVTVLGTAFEVSAYDTSSSVLVRVRHGRVQVLAEGDSVVLGSGGYARYDRQAHLLERLAAPPAEVWGERIIQFQQAPMKEVVERLQTMYSVRIGLANTGLQRCKLTATFEDEPIAYILRVIADTYGFTLVEEKPGTYVLDGEGC
jgi:ferric-dicitrate binding protein FerR (iron transport regulator)